MLEQLRSVSLRPSLFRHFRYIGNRYTEDWRTAVSYRYTYAQRCMYTQLLCRPLPASVVWKSALSWLFHASISLLEQR